MATEKTKTGLSKSEKRKNAWKSLPDVWALIKPRRGLLTLGLGLMFVNRVAGLVLPASTKYFVEAGSTSPDNRLMAMSRKPSASNPRLGFINAQTSGRFFHVFLRFSVFDGDLGSFSAAMICGMKGTLRLRCPQPANIYTAIFYGGTKLLNLQRFLCEVRAPSSVHRD